MPVFELGEAPHFPPAELADENGLLAVGGDLSPERLINAYASGIFPWFNEGEPILWWSTDPRLVLFPSELHVSRSMDKLFRKNHFSVTFNQGFDEVIRNCSLPRTYERETWINHAMIEAYQALHRMGYGISVEVWRENRMVGGLYGIGMGRCFFGESMFYFEANASKYGFIAFIRKLEALGLQLVDCQIHTPHLVSLGAREISRDRFLSLVRENHSLDRIDL